MQFKWSDGRCLTIEPPTCKASYVQPCPLVLGSCADNASRWAERPPHMTHGATSPNAIDIDCNRQQAGAVVKLLGSSPSSVVWAPTLDEPPAENWGAEQPGLSQGQQRGQLQAGGKNFCLNDGAGAPVAPCGLDKALPTQIKLAACTDMAATGGWTRIEVAV